MLEENVLTSLSDAMVQAVAAVGEYTVEVDARRGGSASGIVFQPDMVLTASHAVERDEAQISLPDGSPVQAHLAGRDPGTDLCVLRLDGAVSALPARALGEAQVGQIVLALGRPGKEGIQASLGVVGAVGGPLRTGRGGLLERFIRTDAIPYPGFSGGPLIDGGGRIVGVNTSGFAPGASLAIPAEHAWKIGQTLSQFGRIRRGYLGVRSQAVELPPDSESVLGRRQLNGLLLVGIERGQPAEQAGLMVGDILVGLNGRAVEDHDALLETLAGDLAGKTIPAELLRGGRLARLDVRIGERR